MNNDLSCSHNTYFIISKMDLRLYCLRKLQTFEIDICIFLFFYIPYHKCFYTYRCVYWGGDIRKLDINRIIYIYALSFMCYSLRKAHSIEKTLLTRMFTSVTFHK